MQCHLRKSTETSFPNIKGIILSYAINQAFFRNGLIQRFIAFEILSTLYIWKFSVVLFFLSPSMFLSLHLILFHGFLFFFFFFYLWSKKGSFSDTLLSDLLFHNLFSVWMTSTSPLLRSKEFSIHFIPCLSNK